MTQVITKSAKRVMEIFERFDQLRRPLSLKDVCDDLGYPISSAAALLKSLVNIGYLEYDKQHRNYLPTMKIAMLGSWVPEELFGRTSILPIMNQVRDFSGESVCLGTRSDLYAQYVHVVHSEAPLRYLVPPGAIRPLARSGFGLLFLSQMDDSELDHIVRRINYGEQDPALKIDVSALSDRLDAIREDGFVFAKGMVLDHAGIIGVLLRPTTFQRTFAIGVAGPSVRLEVNLEANLQKLREAAATIASETDRFAAEH